MTHRPEGWNLDLDDIEVRLVEISLLAANDYEGAHSAEDHLREDVLTSIANGATDPVALATAALLSSRIKFGRHYA